MVEPSVPSDDIDPSVTELVLSADEGFVQGLFGSEFEIIVL